MDDLVVEVEEPLVLGLDNWVNGGREGASQRRGKTEGEVGFKRIMMSCLDMYWR